MMIISFDHPLSERVRSFIRINHLFCRFMHTLQGDDPCQHHIAISSLFEIMECSSRVELKRDMLQELERQRQVLNHSASNPELLLRINKAAQDLQEVQQKFGQHIRDNEWLMAMKQRMSIAGGSTPVEFPSYYFWQQQHPDKRREDLIRWSQAMMPTYHAAELLLEILRHQSSMVDCQAKLGNYQHNSLIHNMHLLTIELDIKENALPEVAANKYFTHIRFLSANQEHMRGAIVERDIPFRMKICSFDAALK